MNEIQDWLPTIIATGALGAFWFLIRSSVANLRGDIKDEFKKLWAEISLIKHDYLEEEKHSLICGKSSLEIEKLFKECLTEFKDAVFSKLRDFEDRLGNKKE